MKLKGKNNTFLSNIEVLIKIIKCLKADNRLLRKDYSVALGNSNCCLMLRCALQHPLVIKEIMDIIEQFERGRLIFYKRGLKFR